MREMKDSGVAWIGEIPKDWSLVRFKDKYKNVKEIAKEQSANYERLALTMGGVIKRPKDDSDGLQPKEFDSYQILRENDFVFKMIDLQNVSTSRVGLSPYTGLVSPAYIRFTPKNEGQYSQFVYYYLMCLYYNQVFNNLGGNGVRSALSAKDMGEFVIPFPDGAEQKKICAMLDEKFAHVDSLIANVQAQIEKLKAYKQSLITEVVTKGLDPNAPMKDSGVEWIGKIPEDWEVVKTGRLFKENNRSPIGNDIPLSLSQMDGLVATDDMKESALKTSSYDNWKRVEIGDLVLNRFKAHLGVLFAANLTGIVSFHYGVYEAKRSLVPKFYEYLYHSNQYKAILGNASNGMVVGLQNLSNLGFYSTYSLYPPYAEQEKLVSHLDKKCSEIDELIALKQSKIEKLEQYKKSLIYEYVTGKKEVV
ncbi:restriction endonuclease subunit S [Gemmiger formicilis]|jgi:type I restriction enzyme S subunit